MTWFNLDEQTGRLTAHCEGQVDRPIDAPSNIRNFHLKNMEQKLLAHALLSDDYPVVSCLGPAGSGKTIVSLAVAIETVMETKKYDELIIMRPTSETGRWKMGALPGTLEEKMGPFLQGYWDNMEQLFPLISSKTKRKMNQHAAGQQQDIKDFMPWKMLPINFIRGASWKNKLVIVDECQVLNKEEMLVVGTRVGEGTKLVLLGDLRQRDGYVTEAGSGLNVVHEAGKNDPLVASITLTKNVRSPVVDFFIKALDG